MIAQFDLSLPASLAPKVLTLDQVRDLIERAYGELETASPRLRQALRVLAHAAPHSTRAALAAAYAVASEEERRILRTLRCLVQLLCDAEAHAARQPGRIAHVSLVPPVAVATAAALPLSEHFPPQP
jgi:hypothetical protein